MKYYPCVPLSDKTVSGYTSEQDCRSHPDVPNCYQPWTPSSEAPASAPALM